MCGVARVHITHTHAQVNEIVTPEMDTRYMDAVKAYLLAYYELCQATKHQ